MRFVVPVLGWSLAVLQHALWNSSLLVVGNLYGREDISVVRVVLYQAPIFTFPPLVALYVIARAAGRRELAILREQLAPEVAAGVLTPREYDVLISNDLRKSALASIRSADGPQARDRLKRFFQIAAELAFRKYHVARGDPLTPGQQAPEDAYRAELANLRSSLNFPGAA
jgi:hypothetical protein